MTKYIIADSKGWYISKNRLKRLESTNIMVVSKKEELGYNLLKDYQPDYVFFVHWNWIVPAEIYNNFECIVFHTAPLPHGRGGSPIQNLIKEGFEKSPVCAIRMTKEIDGGPIYIQKEVSLKGSLKEILNRIAKIIERMITTICLDKDIEPEKQQGKIHVYKRLTPAYSRLNLREELKEIYDQIRMVDALDYPRAFIEEKNYKVEFKKAIIKKNKITCIAEFKKREFNKKEIYANQLTFEKIEKKNRRHIKTLYGLLEVRETGISHTTMPDYNQHEQFVQNNPYLEWYLISHQDNYIGSTYILDNNCIGINLQPGSEKYIHEVIEYIKENHKPLKGIKSVRNAKFYVNVATEDHKKRQIIEETGAKIIQYSYLIE